MIVEGWWRKTNGQQIFGNGDSRTTKKTRFIVVMEKCEDWCVSVEWFVSVLFHYI